jgi:hypothetical protein
MDASCLHLTKANSSCVKKRRTLAFHEPPRSGELASKGHSETTSGPTLSGVAGIGSHSHVISARVSRSWPNFEVLVA